MKRARFNRGSVVFDKHVGTWRFLQWIAGKRKSETIGTKQQFPTKASAWAHVSKLTPPKSKSNGITVRELAERFEAERFPERHNTAQVYRSWLKNHILPAWG